MRILDLHIDGFGKFHDFSVSFEQGFNVIYGKNEAGKSTLHSFIRCMFFGLNQHQERTEEDLYYKYKPWQNEASYGGQMRVEKNGVIYRLERNFQKEHPAFEVFNETEGTQILPDKRFLSFLLDGLTETLYTNTISIGQLKSVTDNDMVSELRSYIAHMDTTQNRALTITKATSYLKDRRKEFEHQLSPDAAHTYASLLNQIKETEAELADPKYENLLPTYQELQTQIKSQLSAKQSEREILLQKISKGRQALDHAQFSDENSIRTCLENAKTTYEHYQELDTTYSKASRTILAAIMLVLSVLCGVGAAALGFFSSRPLDPVQSGGAVVSVSTGVAHYAVWLICILSAVAVFFFALGLIFFMKHRSLKQEFAVTKQLMQEIFSRYLGDVSISEQTMNAFESRMTEFIRLNQVLERSEKSVKVQAAELASLQEKEANCDEMIRIQQKTQQELEQKLKQLADCKDQTESLKSILTENERIRGEIGAIDLALETMTNLSFTMRDSFGLYLNKTTSNLIADITGGIYHSIYVDDNLKLFLNTRTRRIPVRQTSNGTTEQIYLALRLAMAKLLLPEGDAMPLILDDSFALYDEDRLRTTLTWLKSAYPGQVLIFTRHQREAQVLNTQQIITL